MHAVVVYSNCPVAFKRWIPGRIDLNEEEEIGCWVEQFLCINAGFLGFVGNLQTRVWGGRTCQMCSWRICFSVQPYIAIRERILYGQRVVLHSILKCWYRRTNTDIAFLSIHQSLKPPHPFRHGMEFKIRHFMNWIFTEFILNIQLFVTLSSS